jgi:hypothetical protein
MAFHVITQFGATERNVSPERMAAVLGNIDPDDVEHVSVSLTHESEWCLEVYASGLVVFENLEDNDPRHMRLPCPLQALELWQQLARGEVSALQRLAWQPGYGTPAAV